MPSLLVTGTAQALALGALSNIIAQVLTARQRDKPFSFDSATFLFFLTWTLISCPPNISWQVFLERKFPGQQMDPKKQGRRSLNKTNTVKKFLLDQIFGATANTVGYIAALAYFRGKNSAGIMNQVQDDFWPLMQAGWRVWPFVALLSFTVIPLERRTLFGSTVGLFWGIYMSFLAAQ
ncbi:hypothetical protein LTR05_007048 [Lithohypha guttulata]|uniref:Mpv17-like protein n=1 Tax=Lithohypha guttulata TaxID=1690604 RepID=A0AAN7Y5B1_9EURO|nr:hypothetical protein LTR05_007048 [Lithohypha guttulata]